eukprot:Nk52_evm53s208 gene=Nk52_evmTU53s208
MDETASLTDLEVDLEEVEGPGRVLEGAGGERSTQGVSPRVRSPESHVGRGRGDGVEYGYPSDDEEAAGDEVLRLRRRVVASGGEEDGADVLLEEIVGDGLSRGEDLDGLNGGREGVGLLDMEEGYFEGEDPYGEGSGREELLRRRTLTDEDDDSLFIPGSGSAGPAGGDGEGHVKLQTYVELAQLNFFWFGTSFVWFLLSVTTLPSQVYNLVGDANKGLYLGAVVAAGSVVSLIFSPMMGLWSDSSTHPLGRRRPFMVGGVVFMLCGLLAMAWMAPEQHATKTAGPYEVDNIPYLTVGAFIISYQLNAGGYVVCSVPYNGLLADKTPAAKRGVGSGLMAMFQTLGNLFGAGFGTLYTTLGVVQSYMIMCAVLAVCLAVTVLSIGEQRLKRKGGSNRMKRSCGGHIKEYLKPCRNADFRWVLITRFLLQQGASTVMFFLQYWMDDVVSLPEGMTPEAAVSYAFLPMLVMSVVSSVSAGWLSDRLGGRRKVIVITSALTMALCVVALAFTEVFYYAVPVTTIFGLGYGSYLAVDFAMVCDILPVDGDNAKDLAVWHTAMVLPQLTATPLGGLIRDMFQNVGCGRDCGFGYKVLFFVTALYFMLSAILTLRIKGVK